MADRQRPLVTSEVVEQLAQLAQLPLTADRKELVAGQLNALLVDANLVNRFMDERRDVQPSVRFLHDPAAGEGTL